MLMIYVEAENPNIKVLNLHTNKGGHMSMTIES